MYQFSGFPQKKVQVPTLYSDTCGTVATPYGNCALPAVHRNRLGFADEPVKGTLFVPPLLEPAFSPSRAAHWILRQGNFEEFSVCKKRNLSFPRFLSKNDLVRVKTKKSKSDKKLLVK